MKCKFLFAAFALAASFVGLGAANVSAVKCPAGSMRNPSNVEAEVAGISNVSQCNLPEPEKDADGNEKGVMDYVKIIISVVFSIVGLIAVIMIIIGGISFITSQGDSAKIAKAKNTVLYGVIGLIIALLAFAIVNFVLGGVFGATEVSD